MRIAVIGCGWLGFPLAKLLIELGHEVHGSITQDARMTLLSDAGIQGFLYDGIQHDSLPEKVKDCDAAILNFPPSRSMDYAVQMKHLIAQFSDKTKLIFTSSTGVYQDLDGSCNELSAIISTHPVFLAEEVVRHSGRKHAILRLAGLISEDRHPVKYLAGKQNSDGQKVVNLVHREDVIAVIGSILKRQVWNETFNVCFPHHPSRAEYYSNQAKKRQLTPPTFTFSADSGKEIISSKLIQVLNFTFSNPI